MPRLTRKLPSYRRHKASGRAVVTIDGRDYYLGDFGTPESRAEYDQFISEWTANGRRRNAITGRAPSDVTVSEVILAFWKRAERQYRDPEGGPSGELSNYRDSLRPLKQHFGIGLAREFIPLRLKAVRQSMIESGLAIMVSNCLD